MEKSEYFEIRTPADVQRFQEISNNLHDGHITYVEYKNSGISVEGNQIFYNYDQRSLTIHVLVTSMIGHPTFEIVFRSIVEWRIEDYHFSDMIGFSILFLGEGSLLWADDISTNIDDLKRGSYVVAGSIQYRQL